MDRFSKFFEQFQFVGPCRTETSFAMSCYKGGLISLIRLTRGQSSISVEKKKKMKNFKHR